MSFSFLQGLLPKEDLGRTPVAPRQRLLFVTHHKCASGAVAQCIVQLCAQSGLTCSLSHDGSATPSDYHDVTVLSNADYRVLRSSGGKGVHIIRNPLNVVQSAYYSHLRTHPVEGWPELAKQREVLSVVSREEGMHLTVAFCERDDFFQDTPGPLTALRHWNFDDRRFKTVRVEDFGDNMVSLLKEASGDPGASLSWPPAEDYAFRRLANGRSVGETDPSSHYRSGSPDAWRAELPASVVRYVRTHYRDLLERYYPNTLAD